MEVLTVINLYIDLQHRRTLPSLLRLSSVPERCILPSVIFNIRITCYDPGTWHCIEAIQEIEKNTKMSALIDRKTSHNIIY